MPMRTPPPPRDPALRGTLSIDSYARRHGLTRREVRRRLGSGQLPFIQVRGVIRVGGEKEETGVLRPSTDTAR